MVGQGRCTLAPDDSGRVLDRLAGLEQVISNESVRQALLAAGLVGQRACKLTHEVMLWVVLAMGIFTDLPIRQVFKHARRLRVGEDSPHRSSLCVARQRLGVAPVRHLFQTTVRPLAQPDTPGAFYRGLRLVAIDGVVFNTPDTEANDKAFGRPSGGDRGMGAFPQVRKVSLVEVGTHVELALVLKPLACGETIAMEGLWRHIPVSSLLLEDRGFFSYLETCFFRKCRGTCAGQKRIDSQAASQSPGRLVFSQDLSHVVRPQKRPTRYRGTRDSLQTRRSSTRGPRGRTCVDDHALGRRTLPGVRTDSVVP
jgi:hypothetical protein